MRIVQGNLNKIQCQYKTERNNGQHGIPYLGNEILCRDGKYCPTNRRPGCDEAHSETTTILEPVRHNSRCRGEYTTTTQLEYR